MNTPGPYQKRAKEIYTELRNNIINTVYKVNDCIMRRRIEGNINMGRILGLCPNRLCMGAIF